MKPVVEAVIRQALVLDEAGRVEVVARLLDSLEQEDLKAEDASWVAELEHRAADLELGAVQGVAWEDLRERLMHGRRDS
jgi:putative addiction module component (TIGR02574 family)